MFRQTRLQLDAAADDPESRAQAINHKGYLLLESPTGAVKTLMAGGLVEEFSAEEDVVWFWFAPFKGVVGHVPKRQNWAGRTHAALRAMIVQAFRKSPRTCRSNHRRARR
jgi:hypothetical protein